MSNVLDFLIMVGKLKHLKRTGWVRNKVRDPENVAGHMYRMAIMSFFVKETLSTLDQDRCVKMALVHDLAECIVGDITPFCGVSKEKKFQLEKQAMKELCELAGAEVGKEIMLLWEEYENQTTAEAKHVKELDTFDMVLQAYEYETQEDRPGQLEEFFKGSAGKINSPALVAWLEDLQQRRKAASSSTT